MNIISNNLFVAPMIIFYAISCALTMKIADLLNEHGLKLFRGSGLLFGLLWGAFGVLLVMSNPEMANIILAMHIAFLTRGSLDNFNHQLAGTMVIIGFLYLGTFIPLLFLTFYFTFSIFGFLEDYADVFAKRHRTFAFINEAMLYYPISTLIYCIKYGHWVIFWALLAFTVTYGLIKRLAYCKGYK